MKQCPVCGSLVDDGAVFCAACGTQFGNSSQPGPNAQNQGQSTVQNQYQNQTQYQQPYTPAYDPYDHTAEFDARDISENKVISMLVYLTGAIGIIIALLAAQSSPYASFHVRQALKFTVVEILMSVAAVLLIWTVIVPIAYAVMMCVLFVIKIICFFRICAGKAKEPEIIRSLGFLK